MNIPFLDTWRSRRHGDGERPSPAAAAREQEGITELLSECELLRVYAMRWGLRLDDSVDSLSDLDQLPPRWREDTEELPWFGNDAGLYLGTVIVRSVPGAKWHIWPSGHPVVRLVSGREIQVVEAGLDWAVTGAPELAQVYAEAAEV
ncbi:DUF6278 family protein [Streptomyces sp. DW26H14]|uniref:DUF6278 family protein n=1 Tax=Streptomyces sp. DW26H14 TaxID=3435395 RepID=UPI00403D966B